jgi:hypothetical protein
LVSDEVELAEGDLLARLHFFWFIAEVEDNSHLKHSISLYAKGPYLARKLSNCFAPAITCNVVRRRNQMVAHEIQRFILVRGMVAC